MFTASFHITQQNKERKKERKKERRNMEQQDIPSFTPVIARLDALDRQIQVLEEKHSLSRSHFQSENECKTLSSALEEVHHKGTLMERLAILEKRVLELSLEIDQGNTSRSSSSTVQGPEVVVNKDSQLSTPKRKDGNAVTTPKMELPSKIQKGRASPEETRASVRQKRKHQKKGSWWFIHTC